MYQLKIVKVTVVRLLTRDQASRELKNFEKYLCGPNEALSKKKISNEEYERWMSLLHALGAYKEGEGIEVMLEESFSLRSLRKVLTEKRVKLLEQVGLGVDSITELAKKCGSRNIKNVYQDLQILKKLGFVTLDKDKRRVVPRLLLSTIRLDFR
jgi:DNA-binding transcriptional ArsR family regulator